MNKNMDGQWGKGESAQMFVAVSGKAIYRLELFYRKPLMIQKYNKKYPPYFPHLRISLSSFSFSRKPL